VLGCHPHHGLDLGSCLGEDHEIGPVSEILTSWVSKRILCVREQVSLLPKDFSLPQNIGEMGSGLLEQNTVNQFL
jgi:hypothetical protein